MSASGFTLQRDKFGKLTFTGADGRVHEGVVPVRAFPITSVGWGLALVDRHGHEVAWMTNLGDLPEESRKLIEAELDSREFVPEITRIVSVSSFATPSLWQIETDRGDTTLMLKGEEDIRRLSPSALLVADSHGVHFLIRDRFTLDRQSRKLLDRFL
ncbi:MAG TPA: DUF1854 domain-containing protein [Nitrosospira sp.]|nr:DUF1854 domain-containing protein [Nitrosospira sp.]